MKRLGDLPWGYWLSIVLAAGLAWGVHYGVKRLGSLLPPKKGAVTAHQSEDSAPAGHETKTPDTGLSARERVSKRSARFSDEEFAGERESRFCGPAEYAGLGPFSGPVGDQDWAEVITLANAARADLLKWLQKNEAQLGKEVAANLRQQLEKTSVLRPPSVVEPDLTWRGIGVWSLNDESRPVIRLGNGFLDLVKLKPRRARFELVRLFAQSWAPCEIARLKMSPVWAALQSCLGVAENRDCEEGANSELGWAISTSLAASVADPGCQIPALTRDIRQRCLASAAGGTP